jgi:hypothetical protein
MQLLKHTNRQFRCSCSHRFRQFHFTQLKNFMLAARLQRLCFLVQTTRKTRVSDEMPTKQGENAIVSSVSMWSRSEFGLKFRQQKYNPVNQ